MRNNIQWRDKAKHKKDIYINNFNLFSQQCCLKQAALTLLNFIFFPQIFPLSREHRNDQHHRFMMNGRKISSYNQGLSSLMGLSLLTENGNGCSNFIVYREVCYKSWDFFPKIKILTILFYLHAEDHWMISFLKNFTYSYNTHSVRCEIFFSILTDKLKSIYFYHMKTVLK